ncbi:MAG TPA: hypothetical protein VG711_07000, partial [Phycisphaerales bacterium]|nr:hypothetical protein [Phycisphaerales bacterium]
LSFWVRHDATDVSLTFFARFSTPDNFPAWSGVSFTPVQANTWTQIVIPISLSNPGLFYEGPPGGQTEFDNVFSNIGHLQIGVFGGDLAGVDQNVTFDLDHVELVPAPGVLALCGLAGLVRQRRRTH